MPEAPKAAKVAKPKKPSKLVKENKAVAKAVAAKPSKTEPSKAEAPKEAKPAAAKRPLIKLPYNLRTRSVVRTIVLAIEDPAARKTTNAALRDLRKYSEIKAWADENIGATEFQELLEDWFSNGEVKD
ncbi:MAG: hypothetical protein M0Q93_00435 [Terrimicrobiaceae bacterium]|nr:hypothetical protein [Terrimicrobiaceae bacterium]